MVILEAAVCGAVELYSVMLTDDYFVYPIYINKGMLNNKKQQNKNISERGFIFKIFAECSDLTPFN